MRRHFKQVKWQVTRNGRFGYRDLLDPDFINARSVSLLERLKDAQEDTEPGTRFSFVTTARIADGDPLAELVSNEEGALNLDKLAQGKTDRSKMGAVRRAWREGIGCSDDAELFRVLEGFAILDGQPDMEAMRDAVTTKARSVGIQLSSNDQTASDFRFDSLARQLIKRDIQKLDRAGLATFLAEEGLTVAPTLTPKMPATKLLVRSFDRFATSTADYDNDHTLNLADAFEGRYLKDGRSWQDDAFGPVSEFLRSAVSGETAVSLSLDTHASIAFAAGRTLHLKSGVSPELVQHGRRGPEIWHASDGSNAGATGLRIELDDLGGGPDIAVAISLSRPVVEDVRQYIETGALPIGCLVSCELLSGTSQSGVTGGAHAAEISDKVATRITELRRTQIISRTHFFLSAPNSFLFFLGQQAHGLGSVSFYEFDFDGQMGGSYISTDDQ